MANNSGDDLQILVGGDISPFEEAMSGLASSAQQGAQAVTSAFQQAIQAGDQMQLTLQAGAEESAIAMGKLARGIADANGQLQLFDTSHLQAATAGFQGLAQSSTQATTAIQGAADAAPQATKSIADLQQGNIDAAQSANSAADAMKEFGTTLRDAGTALITIGAALSAVSIAIVDLGANAIETAGNFERIHITFTALLGSSQAASAEMSKLADIANASGQSIDSTFHGVQQMLARGFDVSQANSAFQTLTAASGALNIPIDNLIRSFDSLQTRGTAALQQMARAGIPVWQMLSQAAGTSITEIREIVRKGGIDAETIMDTLLSSIHQKWGALPGQIAASWQGLSQQVSNQLELAMNAIGAALLPAAKSIAADLIPIIEAVQKAAEWFGQLPVPVQDAAIALGVLAAAVGPVTIAIGAFLFAAGQIATKLPALAAVLGVELPAAFTATTVAAGEATVAIEANAAAAATAGGTGGGVSLLAGAMGTLGKAVAVAAAAFVGWELGKWLSENVPLWGKFFGAAVDGFASLKQSLEGTGEVTEQTRQTITQLEFGLQKAGAAVDGTDMSWKDYAKAVLAAAQQHGLLITSVGTATSRIDLAADALKKFETAQKTANDAVARAQDALTRAQAVLAAYSKGTQDYADAQKVVIRAQNDLQAAVTAANPVLKDQGKAIADATVYTITGGNALEKFSTIMEKVPQGAQAMAAGLAQGFNFQRPINSLRDLETELTNMGADSTAFERIYSAAIQSGASVTQALAKAYQDEAVVLAGLRDKVDAARQAQIAFGLSLDPSKPQTFTRDGIQVMVGGLNTFGMSMSQIEQAVAKQLNIPLDQAKERMKLFKQAVDDSVPSVGGLVKSVVQLADGSGQSVTMLKPFVDQVNQVANAAKNAAGSLTTMQQAQVLMNSTWAIGADNAGLVALKVAQLDHAHADAVNNLQVAKQVYEDINQRYHDGTVGVQELQQAIQEYISAAKAALDPTGKLGGSMQGLHDAAQKAGGQVQQAASDLQDAADEAEGLGGAAKGASTHVAEFGNSLDGSSTSLVNYIGLLDAMGASLGEIANAAAAAGFPFQTGQKSFMSVDAMNQILAAAGSKEHWVDIPGVGLRLVSEYTNSAGGGTSTPGTSAGTSSAGAAYIPLNSVATAATAAAAGLSSMTTAVGGAQQVWQSTYNEFIALGNSVAMATKQANDAVSAMTNANGVFVALSTSGTTAASALDSVATAAASATTTVNTTVDNIGALGLSAEDLAASQTSSWNSVFNAVTKAGLSFQEATDAANLAAYNIRTVSGDFNDFGGATVDATTAISDLAKAAAAAGSTLSSNPAFNPGAIQSKTVQGHYFATQADADAFDAQQNSLAFKDPAAYAAQFPHGALQTSSVGGQLGNFQANLKNLLALGMDFTDAVAAAGNLAGTGSNASAYFVGSGGGLYTPPIAPPIGGPAVIGPYDSLQTSLTQGAFDSTNRQNQMPITISGNTFVGVPSQQVVASLGDAIATYITNKLRQQAGQKV